MSRALIANRKRERPVDEEITVDNLDEYTVRELQVYWKSKTGAYIARGAELKQAILDDLEQRDQQRQQDYSYLVSDRAIAMVDQLQDVYQQFHVETFAPALNPPDGTLCPTQMSFRNEQSCWDKRAFVNWLPSLFKLKPTRLLLVPEVQPRIRGGPTPVTCGPVEITESVSIDFGVYINRFSGIRRWVNGLVDGVDVKRACVYYHFLYSTKTNRWYVFSENTDSYELQQALEVALDPNITEIPNSFKVMNNHYLQILKTRFAVEKFPKDVSLVYNTHFVTNISDTEMNQKLECMVEIQHLGLVEMMHRRPNIHNLRKTVFHHQKTFFGPMKWRLYAQTEDSSLRNIPMLQRPNLLRHSIGFEQRL